MQVKVATLNTTQVAGAVLDTVERQQNAYALLLKGDDDEYTSEGFEDFQRRKALEILHSAEKSDF